VNETNKLVIIGSGPAGLTAALYLSRANLAPLLFAGSKWGGQLMLTTLVENFPGFPDGIQGPQLMMNMRKQVERLGVEFVNSDFTQADFSKKPFSVTADGKVYQGKSVIIATGADSIWLNVAGELQLRGKGISTCATCDAFFFKNKVVAVVGGGDTAMEEAVFLTRFATRVTIVHRRGGFRASPIMLKRAQENPKISFLTNKVVEEVLGEAAVTGVRLKDVKSGQVMDYPTQGFFLAIGHKPNTGFLKGIIDLDAKGYIYVTGMKGPLDSHTKTNIVGIFAAGDCVDFKYRQAVVAAGMGCMAAMDAQRWLEEKNI